MNQDIPKILLILDLDETLIYATADPQNQDWDFEIPPYKVYKRPGLHDFLKELTTYFEVAVWSSAGDEYVQKVVDHIFPDSYKLQFVWGRSKATLQVDHQTMDDLGYSDYFNHMHYVKRLTKVKNRGYDLKRVLIIDDTPRKSKYNYGNAIHPTPFEGDKNDCELPMLLDYLKELSTEPNMRSIEKRFWKRGNNGDVL